MLRWLLTGPVLVSLLLAACGRPNYPAPISAGGQAAAPGVAVTPSARPTIDPPQALGGGDAPPGTTATPVLTLPTRTPYPDDDFFSLGESAQGRPISAWRFGDGPRRIVLIGGIHGGYEANTIALAELLVDHFRDNPADALPGVEIVIIPTANPDGLAVGAGLDARFNANGVDLNRNWGCDWQSTAVLRDIAIDPGPRPFSEPESQILRAYFLAEPPDAVVFFHSAIGAVFMGACGAEHPPADWMGDLLADATGYPYSEFSHYDVTGDASNWLAERDIPAAVIELVTRDEPEFSRNLAGVMALQCHFAQAEGYDAHPDVVRLCELVGE
jgi:hypothetical protein